MSMTYAQAAALVIEDQLTQDIPEDEATPAAILAHVRNTLTLPGARVLGGWPIEDAQDALSAAYVLIVATTDEGATIAPFTPEASPLADLQARGHLIRSGHRLTGYYVTTTGGLSTLIRTCPCGLS